MMMKKILHREKIIDVFLKYPILYFSLYFLYSTRSQFYIIKNIAIYDSIFHNLLVLWGLVIAFSHKYPIKSFLWDIYEKKSISL